MKPNYHAIAMSERRDGSPLDPRLANYVLRRSDRKTLALSVDAHGLRVCAPRRVSIAQIEAFVQSHRDWALNRLDACAASLEARRLVISDGVCVSLIGVPLRVHCGPRLRGVRWCRGVDGIEELHLPRSNALQALERALRVRALVWFEGRVEECCRRLGVEVPRVALGAARTRWGSCSLRSGIRLHWKLALLAPEVADYVVAHEVAHLREMNHSPRFWHLVGMLCPDWRSLRLQLRQQGARMPEFDMPEAQPGADREEGK